MHRAGIEHLDLNLGNLITDSPAAESSPRVLILDWDRARQHSREGEFALRNLLRLFRSGLKIQPDPELFAACLRSFLKAYFQNETARQPAPAKAGLGCCPETG